MLDNLQTAEYYAEKFNYECPDCAAMLVINQHGDLICSECEVFDTEGVHHVKLNFDL